MNTPKTVGELFPSKYISPEDLGDKTFGLVVDRVEFHNVHDRFEGDVQKAVVFFTDAKKGLILNKTQAIAIASIAGTDEFSAWPGVRLNLRAGLARNGKQTIIISASGAIS